MVVSRDYDIESKDDLQELMGLGKEDYDRIYYENIFPQVLEKFCDNVNSRKQNAALPIKHLIITVGKATEPIILMLSAFKPDTAFFLYSKETKELIDGILDKCGLNIPNERKKIVPSDVEDIYKGVFEAVVWCEKKKDEEKEDEEKEEGGGRIAINITGGKKTMSSAAALAASELGVDAYYIDSDNEKGRTIPGTEKLVVLPNPQSTLATRSLETAAIQFNERHYTAALKIVKDAGESFAVTGKWTRNFELLSKSFMKLCAGYIKWSEFSYENAANELEKALSGIKGNELGQYDSDFKQKLEDNAKLLRKLSCISKDNTSIFTIFKKNPSESVLFPLDLFCRASYEKKSGSNAMALILLYRTTEAVCQYLLAQKGEGIDTEHFDAKKIEDDVIEEAKDLIKAVVKEEASKPGSRIGLMWGVSILLAYNNEVICNAAEKCCKKNKLEEYKKTEDMKKLKEDYMKKLNSVIDSRNKLILIHGKKSSEEENSLEIAYYNTRTLMIAFTSHIIGEDLKKLEPEFEPAAIKDMSSFKRIMD